MNNPDYCELCGKVEVFDGKVCKQCEERISRVRQGAVDNYKKLAYNQGGSR